MFLPWFPPVRCHGAGVSAPPPAVLEAYIATARYTLARGELRVLGRDFPSEASLVCSSHARQTTWSGPGGHEK